MKGLVLFACYFTDKWFSTFYGFKFPSFASNLLYQARSAFPGSVNQNSEYPGRAKSCNHPGVSFHRNALFRALFTESKYNQLSNSRSDDHRKGKKNQNCIFSSLGFDGHKKLYRLENWWQRSFVYKPLRRETANEDKSRLYQKNVWASLKRVGYKNLRPQIAQNLLYPLHARRRRHSRLTRPSRPFAYHYNPNLHRNRLCPIEGTARTTLELRKRDRNRNPKTSRACLGWKGWLASLSRVLNYWKKARSQGTML